MVAAATHGRDLGRLRERSNADHDVRLAQQDRSHEPRDVRRVVLTVAVEVDDEIGARRERGVDARPERGDEAPRAPVPLDVVGPRRPRDERRAVHRAVVDDDHLDVANVWNLPRDGRHDRTDAVDLVQRGNHDRQLEGRPCPAGYGSECRAT